MSGNVAEWCWNWNSSSYDLTTEGGNNPTGVFTKSKRICRGGSWYDLDDNVSVSNRSNTNPYGRGYVIGFRVVRGFSN
jgi:formylglycine-generating enzyme required for sulfatase activity